MADDRDILTVLERRFADLTERLDQRFDQVDRRFEQVDARFDQVDQRFEGIDQRFEGIEGEIRHVQVQIEGLRDTDRQLAEGIATVDQKLDRLRVDMDHRFEETQSMIKISFGQLEERLRTLEGRYDELDARLTALESGRH